MAAVLVPSTLWGLIESLFPKPLRDAIEVVKDEPPLPEREELPANRELMAIKLEFLHVGRYPSTTTAKAVNGPEPV